MVDVDKGTASIEDVRRRQITPMDPRKKMEKLAPVTAQRIFAGEKHPHLEWRDEGNHVSILVGDMIPATN